MGSLTACWKLCFNMPAWVWKKISFLIRINPALTHVSRPAGHTVARWLLRTPPTRLQTRTAAAYLHIQQLQSSSLTHLEAKVNSGARVFPSLITLEGNICLFLLLNAPFSSRRSPFAEASPFFQHSGCSGRITQHLYGWR